MQVCLNANCMAMLLPVGDANSIFFFGGAYLCLKVVHVFINMSLKYLTLGTRKKQVKHVHVMCAYERMCAYMCGSMYEYVICAYTPMGVC